MECSDKTLYCGFTDDIERRLAVHNSGKGAKYTRSRLPVKVVYFEEYDVKTDALKREYEIKRLPRCDKILLQRGKSAIDKSQEKS